MSKSINLIEIYKEEIQSIVESTLNKTLDEREAKKPKPVKLHNSKEVKKILGISDSTFLRYIKSGIIKAIKVNGSYRVKDDVLQELLADVKSLKYKRA